MVAVVLLEQLLECRKQRAEAEAGLEMEKKAREDAQFEGHRLRGQIYDLEARLKDVEAKACHCGCPACRNDGPVCSYSDLEARLAAADTERKRQLVEQYNLDTMIIDGLIGKVDAQAARIAALEAEIAKLRGRER